MLTPKAMSLENLSFPCKLWSIDMRGQESVSWLLITIAASAQALVYGMRVIPTHPSAGLHSLQSIFKNYKNSLLIHSMYMGQMEKLRLREFTHLRDTY